MSGICGIINFDGAPVDPDVLRRMTEAAAYRGPDGINYRIDRNVGLAHLALHSTPESLRERQPLCSSDGALWLIADARVDNRDELIRTLTAECYLKRDDPTDADLILAAYECWGEECPLHLIGDFAFAVWNARQRLLFGARDALGTRPLHYAVAKNTLCIATEAHQILQHPSMPCRLDEATIADFLMNCAGDERSTFFVGVHSLPPAHSMTATPAGTSFRRYWRIDTAFEIRYKRDDEYAAHFSDLFSCAVADRLRSQSDTIGITMSGGLDSCSVAAVAHKILCQSKNSHRLVAYSYAYNDLKQCDEREYSRAMIDELGLEVEYIDAERYWFLGDPAAFRPNLESPFQGWGSLTHATLSRLRERGARVWLTGNGGDCLLWGSGLVYADRLLQGQLRSLWDLALDARRRSLPYRDLLTAYVLNPLLPPAIRQAYRRLRGRVAPVEVPAWITGEFAERTRLAQRSQEVRQTRKTNSLARDVIYDAVMRVGELEQVVPYLDRTGAEFGVDVRCPFLDRRLAEFAAAVPGEQLYGRGWRKWVLRQAMAGVLPDRIRWRRGKTNFTSFHALGLQRERTRIMALLEAPLVSKLRIIDAGALMSTYQQSLHTRPEQTDWTFTYAIYLELWLQSYSPVLMGET